jgi:nonsense-mediated mRNA decay protein 3
MGFDRFCAKCGKTTDALIHGLCSDCYLKKHDLFEVKEIHIEKCVKCGKVLMKGKWQGASDEAIGNEVASKVKPLHDLDQPKILVELNPLTEIDFSAKITVEGFLYDVLVSQTKTSEFSLQKVSCDACMKLVSNYREAIIQLRADDEDTRESMLEVAKQFLADEQSKDSLSAAIKTLKGPTGYDLWIGSNKGASKVARKLSKLYKVHIKSSKKIIGEEGGRGNFKYRFTYLLKK